MGAAGEGEDAVHPHGGTIGRFAVDGMIGAGGLGIVLSAHDRELDRRVAIKVLRAGPTGRERLMREAQAMARVAHPNAVTIYEVGRTGDELFIAMELVDGMSLRRWLSVRARPWRDIVAMFVGAGRGLAAMHGAGLVHRDFKPDNVMVRADGRPQVGDFGLATDGIAPEPGELAEASPSTSLTVRGEVIGTPSVMAPEQWRGGTIDARADQFAFAVSLWGALFDDPPFEGDDVASLREAVLDGRRRPRPAGAVPQSIVAALERALAGDAAARWPRLDDLLARLERGLGARRRRAIVAGAGVALVGTAVAVGFAVRTPAAASDPCPLPAAQLDAVWSDARARELGAHVLAIDPAQGAARVAAASRVIEPFLATWRAQRIDACRATRVRGAQSDTLFDLRVRCLDRHLDELHDAIALVADAPNASALDHAVMGLVQLPGLDACADAAALQAAAPPPEQPAARAKADAIGRTLDQISAHQRADRTDGLLAQASQAVADARTLDHAPTLASALGVFAKLQLELAQHRAAADTLRELTQVAARAHDDRDEAFAWTRLVEVVGYEQGDINAGIALVPAASASVLRAGDPIDLRAALLYAQGQVLDESPHPADGVAKLDEARALLERAGAGDRGSSLASLYADVILEIGTAQHSIGDTDAAAATFHRAIDLDRALYGPDSADESFTWQNLGETLRVAGRHDEAADAWATAIRIRAQRLGDSPALAQALIGSAENFADERRWADALPLYDRALAMLRTTAHPDDPQIAMALMGQANVLIQVGRNHDAETAYDDALALFERTGDRTLNLPITYYNRGELFMGAKRYGDAIADYDRAIAVFVEMRGKDDRYALYPLEAKGLTLLLMHRPVDAIAPLERARAIGGTGNAALQDALARFYLGRAQVESGRDAHGGRALAVAARKDLANPDLHAAADEVAEMDRWLASH
jgi:tetratricopeptide (TPR) repeat protein